MPFSAKRFLEKLSFMELKELGLQAGVETDPTTGQPKFVLGFAVALGRKQTAKELAQQLTVYIDDHRVLYEKPAEWEHVSYSIVSVVSLRDYLGKTILPTFSSDTQLSENVKRMRDACREFMKLVERMEQPEKGFFAFKDSNYRQFDIAVARLRREFAAALLALSLAYDLSIPENLSQLISVAPNFNSRLVSEDKSAE